MSQAAIADQVEAKIDRLIETWMTTVRDDPRIQSDARLSKPELIDHVPAIVLQICELIRNDQTPDVRNSDEARANVYVRFHQGYKGRDLIRELSLLRSTLLEHLEEISSDKSIVPDQESSYKAARIVNMYLDEEMRYAISVFGSAPNTPDQEPQAGDS
jgi:RsbRD-like negative regulator of sigma factor